MHSARLHAPPRHGRRCHHRRRLRTLGDGVPAHVQQLAGFQQPGGPLGDDYWGTLNNMEIHGILMRFYGDFDGI